MIQKKSTIAIVLSIIIAIGICIRVVGIERREIYGDESIYYKTAVSSTTEELISIKHKFKDHGILYFLFIKATHNFVKDIPTLRYTNIVLYGASALLLFLILKKITFGYISLFGVFLYSIHWHFIQLSTMLSPYNLVIPFSLASLYLLLDRIDNKNNSLGRDLLFAVVTALSMYADYSFFYLFYFYLFVLLYLCYKGRWRNLIRPYSITILLVLPGLLQFNFNFEHITILFDRVPGTVKFTFIEFLADFGRITMFLPLAWVGICTVLGMITYLVFASRKKKLPNIFLLVQWVVLTSFIMCALTLFIIHQYIFPLYIPRSFWVFHFLILMIITLFIHLNSHKVMMAVVVCAICIANLLGLRIDSYSIPHNISDQIRYSSLLIEMSGKRAPSSLVLYDPYFACEALVSYYFSPYYPPSDKYYSRVNKIRSNNPEVIRLRKTDNINLLLSPWENDTTTTIIICDTITKGLSLRGDVYSMNNLSFEYLKP